MRVYFLITVDTECDKSKDWSVRYPFQFDSVLKGIPEILQPLFGKYGVKPTYLLSPEVISNSSCVTLLRGTQECELGTHLHGEYVEPDPDFFARATEDFQADYPKEIEFRKMENLTRCFSDAFGRRPRSFRAGRFGFGPHTTNILSELGYEVDSSIYPFSRITMKSGTNSFYYRSPKAGYLLQTDNKASTTRGVFEVPLTVYSKFYFNLPRFVGRPISNHPTVEAVFSRVLGRKHVKTYSLRPSTYSAQVLIRVIDSYVALHREEEPVFLNMMFHSNEIIAGASPYAQTEEEVGVLLSRMEQVFQYCNGMNAEFVTLGQCKDIFESQGI